MSPKTTIFGLTTSFALAMGVVFAQAPAQQGQLGQPGRGQRPGQGQPGLGQFGGFGQGGQPQNQQGPRIMREEWEDQKVNFVNVEPVRSDSALPHDEGQKNLLNGEWKFNFVTMTGQDGTLELSQRPACNDNGSLGMRESGFQPESELLTRHPSYRGHDP